MYVVYTALSYLAIRIPECGYIMSFCFWNLESLALESGIQLQGSRIRLTIGIWNLSSTEKESGIQYLESGIHSLRGADVYH